VPLVGGSRNDFWSTAALTASFPSRACPLSGCGSCKARSRRSVPSAVQQVRLFKDFDRRTILASARFQLCKPLHY